MGGAYIILGDKKEELCRSLVKNKILMTVTSYIYLLYRLLNRVTIICEFCLFIQYIQEYDEEANA